jgi:type II secretion system protein G
MYRETEPGASGKKWIIWITCVLVLLFVIWALEPGLFARISPPPQKALIVKTTVELKSFRSALENYRQNAGVYPTTTEGLAVLVDEYIEEIPKDSWGREFYYQNTPRGEIVLFSLGRNGVPGGEEHDQDIYLYFDAK